MSKDHGIATRLTQLGRDLDGSGVSVNPPVYRASTFVFSSLAELDEAWKTPFSGRLYGRNGTPTSAAFETAVADISGAHAAVACASGVAGIMAVFLAFLNSGDHVLIPDSVYDIARRCAERTLRRMGIEITYYDPAIGAGVEALVQPNTKLIYMESPGSGTFDMQDVPAIVAVAQKHGLRTALDNTWATPLFFRPLTLGVDAVIEAATKYIVGHSDAMLGVVACNEAAYLPVRMAVQDMGAVAGTEEINLGLRGLRTLETRLARHQASALKVAEWLQGQEGVRQVLYPALPGAPGHEIWKRDFSGASGLMSFELPPLADGALEAMVSGMAHFKLGYSWGGFESLILPAHPENRKVAVWKGGPVVRIHIGLEDVDDLIADLDAGLRRLRFA
ncbi:cystathionine beta-lyase [Ruixingdingia sedimenti]|uniref:Cystathionine beta-lyase n=1 Tax=Ruixingdingia sedimenti TaxID=3073604 RepID=A0ABU1F6S4_9RHOB|nr:cystathionine beta-lyase [Xinfangfangia sp. LG-4]MDR5652564.1 cystathionine beta-lyase [Xinfangfangia sp. LG-4]